MELCAFCQNEDTALYKNDLPICLRCANSSPANLKARVALFRDMHEAVKRAEAATDAFAAMAANIPSGTPHPDGVQRIHNASRELTAARDEMMKAHSRLNDFLDKGVMPDDLKRSG